MSDLDIFDHRRFNGFTDQVIINKFKKAGKFLGYGNMPTQYVNEYLSLVKEIKRNGLDLCDKADSSPRKAWYVFFEKNTVSGFLKKAILSATIIPFGTAEGKKESSNIMINPMLIVVSFQWSAVSQSWQLSKTRERHEWSTQA